MEKQQDQEPNCGPRTRKEASAQEVRGYHKQIATAKHLEWESWIDNEVFDLVVLEEVQTEELRNQSMGTYPLKQTSRATSSGQRRDGY